MRLAYLYDLAGLGLPVPVEDGVEILVQLACRVVGDVEQCRLGEGAAQADCDGEPEKKAKFEHV